jgi:hypothetical protein
VHLTMTHLNNFSLSDMLHHKVLDLGFRVSATAPASNPSDSVLEATLASNPSGSVLEVSPASNPSGNSSVNLVS